MALTAHGLDHLTKALASIASSAPAAAKAMSALSKEIRGATMVGGMHGGPVGSSVEDVKRREEELRARRMIVGQETRAILTWLLLQIDPRELARLGFIPDGDVDMDSLTTEEQTNALEAVLLGYSDFLKKHARVTGKKQKAPVAGGITDLDQEEFEEVMRMRRMGASPEVIERDIRSRRQFRAAQMTVDVTTLSDTAKRMIRR